MIQTTITSFIDAAAADAFKFGFKAGDRITLGVIPFPEPSAPAITAAGVFLAAASGDVVRVFCAGARDIDLGNDEIHDDSCALDL